MNDKMSYCIEICIDSVQSAVHAKRGGRQFILL